MERFESKVGDDWIKYTKDENIEIGLHGILTTYKDPKKVDALIGTTEKAEEIKVILHENIRKLLERGENSPADGALETLQGGTLRYSRAKLCATVTGWPCR